ncbi:hypothetical protein B9G55_05215 [Saccharibacillus sp. O16]|nr:hypothetical protein B9G55_05215 [Saccharibacillus sp. O16]
MNDGKFDELFDEAFERAIRTMSPTDPESRRASWERVKQIRQQNSSSVQENLNDGASEQQAGTLPDVNSESHQVSWERVQPQSFRTRYKRTIRMTSIAAGLILLGSIAFSEPVRTGALNPLYQKLYTWSTGEAVIELGEDKPLSTEGALTAPPPDEPEKPHGSITEGPQPGDIVNEIIYHNEWVGLNEIKARLAFPMPEFPRIPPDLKLDQGLLSVPDNGEKPDHFLLYYSGDGERTLTIEVRRLPEDGAGTIGFGNGKATEIEFDNGTVGQYIDRGGSNVVHLIRGHIDFSIMGVLEKQELLDIAEHIVDGTP